MSSNTVKPCIVETDTLTGAYGIAFDVAIVETIAGARIYVAQQYGGEDTLDGGTYRWEHAVGCRVLKGDTLASLDETDPGAWDPRLALALAGYDSRRPILDVSRLDMSDAVPT